MKLFKQSLLVAAVLSGLSACSEEDFTPKAQVNDNAPTHGGDINVTLNEKADFQFLYMLGTPDGKPSGDGVAVDLDGNPLTVTDIVVNSDDTTGIEMGALKVGVRPELLVDQLDTGDTHTVTISYKVSDGVNTVDRNMVINIAGEDFAPEVPDDVVANYKKDAGTVSIDLLVRTSDADGEALMAADLQPSDANPYPLTASIVDNQLVVDIDSVADDLPNGVLSKFEFSYKVKDHNHAIDRTVLINILGVNNVPGAPEIANYFLTESVDETATLQTYDLSQGVVDNEGDAIVISDLKVDGVTATDYVAKLDGTNVLFNPNAFFTKVKAGQSKDVVLSYKVSDDMGNTADGERLLTVTVNGVESNLLKAAGLSTNFDDGKTTGFTASNCPQMEVSNATSVSGDNSFRMLSNTCFVNIQADYWPSMAANEKYYFNYWLNNDGSSPFMSINDGGPNNSPVGNFWAGDRPSYPQDGTWRPLIIQYDTNKGKFLQQNNDGKTLLDVSNTVSLYMMSAYADPNGQPYFDDFNLVRFSDIEGVDALKNSIGSFDDVNAIIETTGGTVEVTANNTLSVDTTGANASAANPMIVSLPIEQGAIQPNGKYLVTYDIQYTNNPANEYSVLVNVSSAAGSVNFQKRHNLAGGGKLTDQTVVLDEASHWNGVGVVNDWSADDLKLNFKFESADAKFIIDNVTIHAIP